MSVLYKSIKMLNEVYLSRPAQKLPNFRSECLAWRQDDLYRFALIIHGSRHDSVPPPLRRLDIVQCERDEYDDCANRQAKIEACRREVVEPAPPPEMPLLNDELEDVADDAPRQVV